MTAPTTAYRHSLIVNGADENQPPSNYGVTPATIIGGTVGTVQVYTPAQLATISADDLNFVALVVSMAALQTGRSNHLFQHDGISGVPAAISFLTRYAHFIGLNPSISYREKMYIWDNVTAGGQWEELDAFNGGGIPITLSGAPSGPLSNYVDAGDGDKVYCLQWDWEGTRRVQPGCVHEETSIWIEGGGKKRAGDLRPYDKVFGREFGHRQSRIVDEVTYHHPIQRKMVTIACGSKGSFTVTNDHHCAVGPQAISRAAELVEVGDVIPDAQGNVWPVTHVERGLMRCGVVDIDVRSGTYAVGDSQLLVRTMARA